MRVTGYSISVLGSREENQDAFLVDNERSIFAVADGVSTFAADFFAGAFLAAGFAAGLTARLVAGFAVTALFGFAVAAVDFLTAGLRVGVTLAELLFLDSISKVFCGIAW